MPSSVSKPMSITERDAENETREKLIAAGETLFAQQGYQRVSVRAIAAAADVNWSLLGYYFRGKEGLLSELYRRHCGALNSERLRLLEAARAASQPPQLEKVIEAFVFPALSVAQAQPGGASFVRLRTILAAENSQLLDQLVAENFDLSSAGFIDAFCECLPHLSRDEVLWRFHFMLGTIYYTASGPHRIKIFSEGRCDPSITSETVKHLIPFLAAAFRSPAIHAEKPSIHAPASAIKSRPATRGRITP
jgi:AcrR family transcriptional regulator